MARRLLALCTLAALGILVVLPRMAAGSEIQLRLNWTIPGDDGWIGRASQYDVRVSRSPITEANFKYAGKVAALITPGVVGGKESLTVTGLTPGVDYYFALKTRDEKNNWSPISNVVLWSDKTLTAEPALTPLEFSAPRPNPARSQTRFSLTLPTSDLVRVEVFDLTGRRIRTIAQGEERAGSRELVWNLTDDAGTRLPVGVYLVRAQIGKTAFTRRVSVVR